MVTVKTSAKAVRKAATPAKAASKTSPKTAAKPAPKPAVKKPAAPAAAVKPVAEPKLKHKLVRDSFTIPKAEYTELQGLKLRAANLKRPVKKSELLRAGVSALRAMNDAAFLAALSAVPSLKTGRPKAKAAAE
ncbi:MAG TPA: hypothetical protein VGM74_07125 [Burkholderiaceae bacterium]|jgi:hypothetical protein